MIHILDDFYVSADSYCYSALIDTHRTNDKNETVYKTIGYYQDMKSAIEGMIKYQHRKLASEKEMKLNEYIKECEKINECFTK